jgi:hypothetical protein
MTVKCKCPLGDLIWKIKVFYSILYQNLKINDELYRSWRELNIACGFISI